MMVSMPQMLRFNRVLHVVSLLFSLASHLAAMETHESTGGPKANNVPQHSAL